jgi:GNAT superfamily N-acetyltransferase
VPLIRRRATLDDIPRMVEMGEAFTAAVQSPVPFDPDGFAERMTMFIGLEDAFIQLLDDRQLGAVGGIGAFCAPHFLFMKPMMASELFWWIEPEYRGGTAALRLIEDYERWARQKGCGIVAFSMFEGDDKVQRVLERRGFKHMESAFAKALD